MTAQIVPADLPIPTRDQIFRLQASMEPIAAPMPEPQHYFAPGMYLRRLVVPAGALVVGKTHRFDHFLIVTSGRSIVISEFGRQEVGPGHVSVSKAGVKRVVMALEDTDFLTVHLNEGDSQDLEVIEAAHIVPDVEELAAARMEALQ